MIFALLIGGLFVTTEAYATGHSFNNVRVVRVISNIGNLNVVQQFHIDRFGIVRNQFGHALRDNFGNLLRVRNGNFWLGNQVVLFQNNRGGFYGINHDNYRNNAFFNGRQILLLNDHRVLNLDRGFRGH